MKIASGNDRVHLFRCGMINMLVTNFQTGAVSQRPMQGAARHAPVTGPSHLQAPVAIVRPCQFAGQ